jgi:O-antigen ligase
MTVRSEGESIPANGTTRALKWGLVGVVLLAPLPVGAVTAVGRGVLELSAVVLGLIWTVDAAIRGTGLPPRSARWGIAGLLVLGALQALPLGSGIVGAISPNAIAERRASIPSGAALRIENRLLGRDSLSLDPRPALSLEPERTASALRTGAALALLLLVAVSVSRVEGARAIATALLVSAAFQSLYGILVLASGHDKIWLWPKEHYLQSATGTFVNKNHFAGLLVAALPCGLALILSEWRRRRSREGRGFRAEVVELFGREGIRTLFLGLLLVVGIAGLLLSLSRAGIVLGIAALGVTIAGRGRHGLRTRLVVAALLLAVAIVPLLQIGADRLTDRYWRSSEDFTRSGGRAVIWRGAWAMGLDYPVTGAGFGTFSTTYPLYRSPEVRLFFSHAHNDLLQVFAEGGALGLLFLAMILAPLAARVVQSCAGSHGILAVGVGAGLAAMLLHALIDFNFHIPSNAAVAAVLGGMLLGLPWQRRS